MTRTAVQVASTNPARPRVALVRMGAVVLSHPVLDAYAGFVPPLLGVLQIRCELTAWQTASLLSLGPLLSGLCQPVFAALADRGDSRLVGAAGLAVAAAALSCIGLAHSFPALVLLFALGMLGVGAFHPVAAASVGQLAGRHRSAGVTLFFVAGMIGAALGPYLSPRVTAIEPGGFALLRWLMVPGLVTALLLHFAIRDVSHRHDRTRVRRLEPREARRRWAAVVILGAGNSMRFCVNIALLYLFVRWAESVTAAENPGLDPEPAAKLGAIFCGELNALMMLGMGAGGLLAGILIRPGREKRSFVIVPVLLAPAIALLPFTGRAGNYALAFAAGVGYASVIPVAISAAQRLLPHRTSLASSLMMGAAWAVAAVAPPAAQGCLEAFGIGPSFFAVAGLLALSGLVAVLLPGDVFAQAAADATDDVAVP